MANKLMYHAANYTLQEIDSANVERMLESGWQVVEKYDLVAIFHPGLNDHRTIHRADLTTFLNRGYYAEPTTVYHPEEGSRIVSKEQAGEMLTQGWYDTPAKFPKSSLVGVTGAPLPMPVPKAEPITGGIKPLTDLTKAEIAQLYFDTFGQTLDSEQTKAQMIAAFETAKAAA